MCDRWNFNIIFFSRLGVQAIVCWGNLNIDFSFGKELEESNYFNGHLIQSCQRFSCVVTSFSVQTAKANPLNMKSTILYDINILKLIKWHMFNMLLTLFYQVCERWHKRSDLILRLSHDFASAERI